MQMRPSEVDDYISKVKSNLDFLRLEEGLPTQDELDVFLLGGIVPAQPVRFPDPACSACWGRGTTCVCHGQGACRSSNRERCDCWRTYAYIPEKSQ